MFYFQKPLGWFKNWKSRFSYCVFTTLKNYCLYKEADEIKRNRIAMMKSGWNHVNICTVLLLKRPCKKLLLASTCISVVLNEMHLLCGLPKLSMYWSYRLNQVPNEKYLPINVTIGVHQIIRLPLQEKFWITADSTISFNSLFNPISILEPSDLNQNILFCLLILGNVSYFIHMKNIKPSF